MVQNFRKYFILTILTIMPLFPINKTDLNIQSKNSFARQFSLKFFGGSKAGSTCTKTISCVIASAARQSQVTDYQ